MILLISFLACLVLFGLPLMMNANSPPSIFSVSISTSYLAFNVLTLIPFVPIMMAAPLLVVLTISISLSCCSVVWSCWIVIWRSSFSVEMFLCLVVG